MIRKKLLLLFALLPVCALCAQKQQDLTAYVNTMQGSHNTPEFSHGRCTPLVALPQGVYSWSPVGFSTSDARRQAWAAAASCSAR